MSIPAQPDSVSPAGRKDLRVSSLSLIAPCLWLALLSLLYALGGRHCERGNGALWVMCGLGALVCGALALASLRAWRREPASAVTSSPHAARIRFQILLALLLNLLCLLLCLGLAVPLMALQRCQ